MNQDEDHLRLLSIFHYVLGGILALFSCFPIIHLIFGLIMVSAPHRLETHGQPPPVLLGWFFVAFAMIFILLGWALAALILWSGRCLQQRRRYLFSFVMACIECAFVPLGTVLGVFTLIVLMRPTVKSLYPDQNPVR